MRVVIAGGHGQIALRLTKVLADQGDEVIGLVRNPDHVADIAAAGGTGVVIDLEQADEQAVVDVLAGADAAVFAAGAGPGSGNARKDTVDRGAAALFASAAERSRVRRHVQVGSMGADKADEPGLDETFAIYLRAKKAAEDDLRSRDLDWTILRPGALVNTPGTGMIQLADKTPRGEISRDDVALVLAALIPAKTSIGRTLELISGETPLVAAVAAL
ncbi:NAD(P)H-binding protein [Kribbella deserti]|uniref:NAD(P)H-binding protein n=1 Tax=Kribbella deserti TaxID=1926257 RepID=A0ABV6QMF5_9ACTN